MSPPAQATGSKPGESARVPTRAGYVTLVGRPNAGKSTLMNRLIGQHLSIVTPKAQTTWQRVTGLLTTDTHQLVFLDTPGLLEARDLLQRAMLAAALEALHEADVVLLVIDGGREPTGAETRRIEEALADTRAPIHVALNKVDVAPEARLAAWREWLDAAEGPIRARYDVSAVTGEGMEALLSGVEADLPESPFLYPEDDVATAPVRFFAAELVRETVFELYDQEIPYSVVCQVEEFRETQSPIYIQVNVFVERSSQKGIVIGAGGKAIRELGQRARTKIEHFLGAPVYLDLWVKPLKSWRRKRSHLSQLGFRVPEED